MNIYLQNNPGRIKVLPKHIPGSYAYHSCCWNLIQNYLVLCGLFFVDFVVVGVEGNLIWPRSSPTSIELNTGFFCNPLHIRAMGASSQSVVIGRQDYKTLPSGHPPVIMACGSQAFTQWRLECYLGVILVTQDTPASGLWETNHSL